MAKPTDKEILASVKLAVSRRITSIGTILPDKEGRDLCDENDLLLYVRSEANELIVESAMGRLVGRFKIVPV